MRITSSNCWIETIRFREGYSFANEDNKTKCENVFLTLETEEGFQGWGMAAPDAIVTGEDAKKGKPDPEIYLKTAGKLGLNPKDCLVIEDSEVGVIAAYKAGMKVVAVPTLHSKHGDLSKATEIVSSLNDISWEMINRM